MILSVQKLRLPSLNQYLLLVKERNVASIIRDSLAVLSKDNTIKVVNP